MCCQTCHIDFDHIGLRCVNVACNFDDGKPFAIKLMVEGEGRPVMTRAGSMITQQWRQFGIDASTVVAQGSMADRRAAAAIG